MAKKNQPCRDSDCACVLGEPVHAVITPATKWYTFNQNNSGGSLTVTEKLGHWVIIEAKSAREANYLAEDIGLYFDGANDCECCGDRWYQVDESDGYATPLIYSKDARTYRSEYGMGGKYNSVRIHHLDGTIERFDVK